MQKTILVTVCLLCSPPFALTDIHSLQYLYTVADGIPQVPMFSVVGMVDDAVITHFDSKSLKNVPRQEWMAFDADYWQRGTDNLIGMMGTQKLNLETAKQRFNQTSGVHVFQTMYGCMWDGISETTNHFYRFGYEGEDFLSLDPQNFRWVASEAEAVITKNKWDHSFPDLEILKQYLRVECISWLKEYLHHRMRNLERKVPQVSVYQKNFGGVVCHATGFYPEGVMITWKRDGMEMQDDVDMGETLPNEDGTFQKRAVLTISPEERSESTYTCEVTHVTGQQIVLNKPVEDGNTGAIVIGCLLSTLIIAVAVFVGFMMKKKGYKKTSQSDTESEASSGSPKA